MPKEIILTPEEMYGKPAKKEVELTPEDMWGDNPPQGRYTKKPIVGFDGSVASYEEVYDPPEADAVLKWKYGDLYDDSQLFGDILDTWNMGILGKYETNEGRIKRFKEMYPEGDLMFRKANGEEFALGRKTSDEPYRRISGWQTELPASVASLATGASVAAEMIPQTRAFGVLSRAMIDAAATGLGAYTEESIMQTLEKNRESTPLFKGTLEGGVQGLVDVILGGGAIMAAARQLLKDAPWTSAQEAAFKAWNEEGLRALTRFQFSLNPLTQAVQAQRLGGNQKAIEATLKAYESLGKDGLQKYINENGFQGVSREAVNVLIEKQLLDFDTVRKAISTGKMSFSEGSEELSKTMDLYFTLATKEENTLYNEARRLSEDVEFDLEDVHRLAMELDNPIKTRMRDKEVTEEVPVPAGSRTPYGPATHSVTRTVAGGEEIIRDNSTALQEIIDFIKQMNPVISHLVDKNGNVSRSMDQLKTLRQKVWDLYSESKGRGGDNGPAKRLYGAISNALNNPTKGNPDFLSAWQKANEFYNFNRSLEELEPIIKIGKATPFQYARLARNLTTPDQADSLLFLKDFVAKYDPVAWDTFRDGFMTHVLEDPMKGVAALDGFIKGNRKDALRALVTEEEENAIRSFAKDMNEFKSSPLWKKREEMDYALGVKAMELVNTNNVDQLAKEINLAGGPASEHAAALRAGIMQHWKQQSTLPNLYGEDDLIDGTKFLSLVKDMQESGKLDILFREQDWKWLNNMKAYAKMLGRPQVSEEGLAVGAGIQLGEQAGRTVRAPAAVAEAVAKLDLGKLTEEAYKIVKLPFSMSIMSRLMGADKPVKSLTKSRDPVAQSFSLMYEFSTRAPVMWLESLNSLQYEEDDLYTPYP